MRKTVFKKFRVIWSALAAHITPNFLKLSYTNFTCSILEYLDPFNAHKSITWVAFLNPLAPIILIYDQGMLNTAAEPYGAALMTPNEFSWSVPSGGTTGCVGKNGSKCFLLRKNLILMQSFCWWLFEQVFD